jgi:ferrous iron transport protein B
MFNQLCYPKPIEDGIATIEYLLSQEYQLYLTGGDYQVSKRSVALLLLQNDPVFWEEVQQQEPRVQEIEQVIKATQAQFEDPLTFVIAQARYQVAAEIEKNVLTHFRKTKYVGNEWLHKLTVSPITGIPILLLVLYLGIYQFVGVFGAGTLVDLIETFFEEKINPVVNAATAQVLPWRVLQDLLANDYGIITLGVRYAIAIVLPVVTTFFLMFSLLEDSGYLPRLSLLVDRLFKSIGLSGRAVIPMVLGLGCGTMATLVTRTLETKRERLIATLLLALTIPCSAQLGVILGLLSQRPAALLIWGGFMGVIFLAVGLLSSKVLPGECSSFYMEIPPLRLPSLKAILIKTYVRLKWYFGEILPLFVLASVLIWLGKLTGLFDLIVSGLKPVMLWLGLPTEAAPIFLYGFFRRDYGAAGLFDLQQHGVLNNQQLVVAAVTLTLFIPCIAQLQFMLKERGVKIALAIAVFVFAFAFGMGYILNQVLSILEVSF